jgi:small subunit ribosomal protein S7
MRGKQAKKRKPQVDKRYNNELVAKLINYVMLDGKKGLAEKMVYSAMENGSAEVGKKPMEFLNTIFENLRPALEVRSRRVGGATYQVPVPIKPARQNTLVIRWLVTIARKKSGSDFSKLLQQEMVLAFNGEGEAIKKRIDVEKMAEANKAFAHFKW